MKTKITRGIAAVFRQEEQKNKKGKARLQRTQQWKIMRPFKSDTVIGQNTAQIFQDMFAALIFCIFLSLKT